MENTSYTKEMFTIKRSRKLSLVTAIIGAILILLGCSFLYANSLLPDTFVKWTGIITTALGIIIILLARKTSNTPLILADDSGVTFNIAISGKPLFIPWLGIEKLEVEKKGSVSKLRKSFWWFIPQRFYETRCLVFIFKDEYKKKLPLMLKSTYLKEGNKIYFASAMLSIPVDKAAQKLCSIQSKGAV